MDEITKKEYYREKLQEDFLEDKRAEERERRNKNNFRFWEYGANEED
jgi:hypothetical protein